MRNIFKNHILLKNVIPKQKNPWKVKVFIVSMLALPLLEYFIFGLYVNMDGFLLAFRNVNHETNQEIFVGLDNFRRFFQTIAEPLYIRKIFNSLGFFFSALAMVMCGFFFAYFLYQKIPCSKLFIVIFFLPTLIPVAVMAQSFLQMWDPVSGPLSKIFMFLGNFTIDTMPNWMNDDKITIWILYLYSIWAGIGYYIVLIWGAFTRVPQELLESADIDGDTMIGKLFHVMLPIIWGTFSMLLITCISVAFGVYMQSMILANNGINGLTATIYLDYVLTLRGGNYYLAAAKSICISLVSTPIVLMLRRFTNKIYSDVEV